MHVFKTTLGIISILLLIGKLDAMEVSRAVKEASQAAILAGLNGLKEVIKKDNPIKYHLFDYSLLKKVEKPTYELDSYYVEKLHSHGFANSLGQLNPDVTVVIKAWLKVDTKTENKKFKAFLEQKNHIVEQDKSPTRQTSLT